MANENKNKIVLAVYILLSLVGIYTHEVWLDEAHHFLLARDSSTFVSMLQHCRYEGHPLLWNILLFGVTRITANVMGMQLLHIVISTATVYLVLKSPLSFIEKLLIIFGYFMLYEYNVISRNYGICMLLLMAIITIYTHHKERVISMAVLIFLMANTHLFGLALSGAFFITYIIVERGGWMQISTSKRFGAVLIVLIGFAISVCSIIPPVTYGQKFLSYEHSSSFSLDRIVKTLSPCLKGLVTTPNYLAYNTANRFIYTSLPGALQLLLSILALVLPAVVFRKSKMAMILFYCFTMLYCAVYYFLPLTYGARYFGFFYFAFIGCYWLCYSQVSNFSKRLILVVLSIQFVNGAYAYVKDILYPYSESKYVAKYLEQHALGKDVLILSPICRPGISAYTGKKYYDVATGKDESYSLWYMDISKDTIQQRVNKRLTEGSNFLIISNKPPENIPDSLLLKQQAVFDKGFMEGENVSIYSYK
ncbi:MAG: hypothetical protein BGO70_08165 [Bacteroidetes bacterium 43-93]|nr:hypothetical protein [Bacteroidota bacterium]OJW97741.1 MAG: hypothetical protein BGO70_08165 [Bacteroidetes bacterium 43-93]